jgi:lipoprotein-releasing system ATP-binding protein
MNAFEIRDLECAYHDGQTVLKVPYLDIPFDSILVFLGPSGVGKSTLLETLGLMNHTIKSGQVKFAHEGNDFLSLWQSHKEGIPSVRNGHMSFIFQENNLLDNICALENAMMPLLIQGKTEAEAKEIVLEWCHDLDLGFMTDATRVSELSVGQKQRLAFIRAASPGFTVLFGDEPTGNLDERNGGVLMEALRKKIATSNGSMLSIIVSHDINLAIKYADQIVVLTKQSDRMGEIRSDNIYIKAGEGWKRGDESMNAATLRNHISHLL